MCYNCDNKIFRLKRSSAPVVINKETTLEDDLRLEIEDLSKKVRLKRKRDLITWHRWQYKYDRNSCNYKFYHNFTISVEYVWLDKLYTQDGYLQFNTVVLQCECNLISFVTSRHYLQTFSGGGCRTAYHVACNTEIHQLYKSTTFNAGLLKKLRTKLLVSMKMILSQLSIML